MRAREVGIVVAAPLLGGPTATRHARQALLRAALGAAEAVAAAWLLAQYAYEVPPDHGAAAPAFGAAEVMLEEAALSCSAGCLPSGRQRCAPQNEVEYQREQARSRTRV